MAEIKTYKMSLITTLGKNIVAAKTDEQRLRAINQFLDMYNKFKDTKSNTTPIPTFGGTDTANQAVLDRAIPPNSLFINSNNGSYIEVARLVAKGNKEAAKALN